MMFGRMQRAALVFAGLATIVCAGCGGGGSSSSDSGGGSTTTLTTDQQQAVTTSVNDTTYTTAALSPLMGLTDSAVLSATASVAVPRAGSPAITVTRSGSIVTVKVDYGTGTTSTSTGGLPISGSVVIAVDTTAKSGTATFNSFTVNGKTVSGTIILTNVQINSSGVSFSEALDLTISGVGHVQGQLVLGETPNSGVTISSGNLALTPEGSATVYQITFSGVKISPKTTGNFVPNAGTITVSYLPTGLSTATTVAITFSSQSPVNGTVLVSVNGSKSITTTVPGL